MSAVYLVDETFMVLTGSEMVHSSDLYMYIRTKRIFAILYRGH